MLSFQRPASSQHYENFKRFMSLNLYPRIWLQKVSYKVDRFNSLQKTITINHNLNNQDNDIHFQTIIFNIKPEIVLLYPELKHWFHSDINWYGYWSSGGLNPFGTDTDIFHENNVIIVPTWNVFFYCLLHNNLLRAFTKCRDISWHRIGHNAHDDWSAQTCRKSGMTSNFGLNNV